ncbi:MAG: cytochrome c oxidase subunit II [Candidatus Limnocylindrales bacterium]
MSSRRHLITAGLAWAILSAIFMVLVAGVQILPHIASHEAQIEDDAMVLLTVVSIPVLMFVVVGMIYSAIRFRARGDEQQDGPPIHGHRLFEAGWLVITFLMVIGLFGYGAVGLVDLRGAQTADFEVLVHAEQWKWHFEYPAYGFTSDELHLPVGQRARLTIDSDDVIHSLWMPALGIKQDAVPGHPTQAYVTPTAAATFGGQCTELCGFGHTDMTFTVVTADQQTLGTWIQEQRSQAQ